jgi:hypothetical protein
MHNNHAGSVESSNVRQIQNPVQPSLKQINDPYKLLENQFSNALYNERSNNVAINKNLIADPQRTSFHEQFKEKSTFIAPSSNRQPFRSGAPELSSPINSIWNSRASYSVNKPPTENTNTITNSASATGNIPKSYNNQNIINTNNRNFVRQISTQRNFARQGPTQRNVVVRKYRFEEENDPDKEWLNSDYTEEGYPEGPVISFDQNYESNNEPVTSIKQFPGTDAVGFYPKRGQSSRQGQNDSRMRNSRPQQYSSINQGTAKQNSFNNRRQF